MRHLREFIYDKSDILVALVILLVAGLLIFWRFEAIADYPSTLVKSGEVQSARDDSNKNKAKDPSKSDSSNAVDKDSDKSETANKDTSQNDSKDASDKKQSTSGIYDGGVTGRDSSVTVQSGSAAEAANSLVSAGYFDSYDDFISTCQSLGIDPGTIKAGTFNIPAGSNKSDVARIVCAL